MSRNHPLLVYTKTNVVHISRANAPHGKVSTECGREIYHVGHYDQPPEEILKAQDGKLPLLYDHFQYKLCSRCGTKDEFAEARRESIEAIKKIRAEHAKRHQIIEEKTLKTQSAIKAIIISELLAGAPVEDMESKDGWGGVEFTLNGMRLQMKLTDDEVKKILSDIYEEV
jgi:hypothetical protein